MPRGSRIVDQLQTVQDVKEFYVSSGGKVRKVAEGYVADAGIVRQFWPKTTTYGSGIVMDTVAATSYEVGSAPVRALCTFDAQSGNILLSNGVVLAGIAPPSRAQGNYLWKFDIVSGSISGTGTIGSWEDVNSGGTIGTKEYWLENSVFGLAEGEATISLAEDDGGGSPLAGTTVTKTIYFQAEVLGKRICMSQTPWLLTNTEVNETAEVFVLTIPEGWWDAVNMYNVPFAAINGEYGFPKGIVQSEIYACIWEPTITVQVDIVAGAVDGEATGVPLTTDVRRIWSITADATTPVVDATIDVTVTDGVESVTKRITMHAEYVTEDADPGSEIDTNFTRYDNIQEQTETGGGTPASAHANIAVRIDGTVNAYTIGLDPYPAFPQNWNALAPALTDPENYECRVVKISGDDPDTGTLNTWFNCSIQRIWGVAVSATGSTAYAVESRSGSYELQIREVGRPETVQTKPFDFNVIAESYPGALP